jgi:GTP-binding protein
LSVLIEAMRREGYEFEVGRPQVVTITEDGVEKEPVEELQIEVGPEFVGAVSQELGVRRATMLRQEQTSSATARMTYVLPTRAMIGLRNQLLTATKGTVIMNSLPHGYEALGTQLQQTRNGVLIAFEAGTTTPYALENAESRGELFVGPAVEVYAGQIVGLNTRQEDMEIKSHSKSLSDNFLIKIIAYDTAKSQICEKT